MSAKNPRIKRANEIMEYTPDQVRELLKCSQDPIYFIEKYVMIQHPTKGAIPFKLYDYQKTLLSNYQNHRYNIVLSARQTGKSTTSAVFLLWYAIFHDDKTVLIVANRNSNAMEMISRIRYAYEYLPAWLKPGVADDGWNKHGVGFDNMSRILSQATSENSGRGMAISLLFCDEFAFVRPGIQEEFWTSISPTLATGGSCIIASTPNGDANLFAQLWRGAELGVNEFKSMWVKWDEPPGRDAAFKASEIGKIGEEKWQQEYECIFLSSDALLISSILLHSLNNQVSMTEPDARGINWWVPFEKGKTYLIGVDPATGSGKDFSSIEVFSFPDLQQIAEFRSNTTSSPILYLTLTWILKKAGQAGSNVYFSVENNGVGEGVISLYQADENPPPVGEFISEEGKGRLGMTTTGKSKIRACLNFKQLVERAKLGVRSKSLLGEMKNYARKNGSYEAQIGATDDSISATLIVLRLLEEIATYEQDAYDTLYSVDEEEYFGEYDESDVGLAISVGDGGGGSYGGSGSFSDPNDPNSFDPFGGV
jgi:hypothetical protein